jgi:hypothetical protein
VGKLGDQKNKMRNERRPRLSWMVNEIKDFGRRVSIVELALKRSEEILKEMKEKFEEMIRKSEERIIDEPTDSDRSVADNDTIQPSGKQS